MAADGSTTACALMPATGKAAGVRISIACAKVRYGLVLRIVAHGATGATGTAKLGACASTMTADARVAASLLAYLEFVRKRQIAGPALPRVATRRSSSAPSPSNGQSSRAASSASVIS